MPNSDKPFRELPMFLIRVRDGGSRAKGNEKRPLGKDGNRFGINVGQWDQLAFVSLCQSSSVLVLAQQFLVYGLRLWGRGNAHFLVQMPGKLVVERQHLRPLASGGVTVQ